MLAPLLALSLGCGSEAPPPAPPPPPAVVPEAPPPAPEPLAAPPEPRPPAGPDCLSGTLACDETLEGTTAGGSRVLDMARYEGSYCFPRAGHDYHGPERVYAFDLRAGTQATFTLEAEAEDLDLVVLRWERPDRCPGPGDPISECEGDPRPGDGRARIWHHKDARYLVVVDGKAGEGAPFRLAVTCAG